MSDSIYRREGDTLTVRSEGWIPPPLRSWTIFVYTDGVPEATAASGEMFGLERLSETLNRHADASPEDLIHQVRAAVDAFADGAPQFDDITMLSLKYRGPQAQEEPPCE